MSSGYLSMITDETKNVTRVLEQMMVTFIQPRATRVKQRNRYRFAALVVRLTANMYNIHTQITYSTRTILLAQR